MHAVTQPQPLTQPSISPHLLHAKWVWSANEFLWPAINHANEPRPAKDKKLCSQSKTGSLELDFSISSCLLILFFFQTCLPVAALICSPLPLRAPHLPSFHALHSTIFFFSIRIFHTLPQFPLLPHLSISCLLLLGWAAWKQLINSPVLFPLLLLKNVLWDGINQHQVWHLPEDTQRTCAIRWREAQWPSLSTPHGPGYNSSDGWCCPLAGPLPHWPHVCAIRGQHIHLGGCHPLTTSSFSPLMAAMSCLIKDWIFHCWCRVLVTLITTPSPTWLSYGWWQGNRFCFISNSHMEQYSIFLGGLIPLESQLVPW